MLNIKGSEHYEEKYQLDFKSVYIKYFDSFDDMKADINKREIINNVKLDLILAILTQKQLAKKMPKIMLQLNIENANINLTESTYYTLHFIIDIMKPTKDMDYWGVVERNKPDIKKNTKVCGRIMKKNMRFLYYEEFFAVLSGGFIYFYKHMDDEHFLSYFYIKEASLTVNKDTHELTLSNHYGVIELQFPSEDKLKQWTKALTERINEMKNYTEPIEKIENIKQSFLDDKSETTTSTLVKKDEVKTEYYDIAEIIDFGLEVKITHVTANLLDYIKMLAAVINK
jgi:hypothetical protein